MNKKIIREEFLANIHNTRTELEGTVEKVLEKYSLDHKIAKVWRVKDVLAHIVWYEEQMIELIEEMALRGSEYWLLDLPNRNNHILKDLYNYDEQKLLVDFKSTHLKLFKLMESLTEDQLNNSKYFAEMPSDWSPSSVIASNTNEHYESHTRQLSKFLDISGE
ncbi:MAG: ClbS/DfsB family four-helix bundle protein [Candidatus Heimdallarchaeota archaeon]|nr:ClbS/DfsB family four-helix bundle protein [Candidatus Heimdallarchaeota archaeon]